MDLFSESPPLRTGCIGSVVYCRMTGCRLLWSLQSSDNEGHSSPTFLPGPMVRPVRPLGLQIPCQRAYCRESGPLQAINEPPTDLEPAAGHCAYCSLGLQQVSWQTAANSAHRRPLYLIQASGPSEGHRGPILVLTARALRKL
jgi:hypothetical protein